MANVFELTDLVARDAAIELHGNIVAAGMMNGKHEAKFAQKVGQTIAVKVRPVMTANRHTGSGSFSDTNVTESTVNLTIGHRSYVKVPLTGEELTFSVDDFALQVTRPAMLAIAKDVDSYCIDKLVRGFARNISGTAGNSPSTIAHLVAGHKVLFDNECPIQGLGSIIDSTTMAAFLQLAQFTNRDYGEERPAGLRNGLLSQLYDINFYPSQRAGTQTLGDTPGTVLLKTEHAAGVTSVTFDGLTATTGTIYEGTKFTIAGTATIYTVTADATIASNTATVSITPALSATEANDDAITFLAALKEDVIWHPDAAAKALIAPEPQRGNPSAVGSFEGVSVRTTFESSISDSTSGDSESVLFDVFVAAQVIVPDGGVVFQG